MQRVRRTKNRTTDNSAIAKNVRVKSTVTYKATKKAQKPPVGTVTKKKRTSSIKRKRKSSTERKGGKKKKISKTKKSSKQKEKKRKSKPRSEVNTPEITEKADASDEDDEVSEVESDGGSMGGGEVCRNPSRESISELQPTAQAAPYLSF